MNLGEAQARITLDISDLLSKSGQAQGALTRLDSTAGKATGGMGALTKGFLAFGTAAIPAMIAGVRQAANLEQAMANIDASLGGIDTSVLDMLEDGFNRLGAASQFSAIEVAGVGDELAKAGFDPSQIINATQATIDLSQATGTDLMTSVTGISSVMHIWTEEIVGSELALTDATEAADIFTAAANASNASVGDIIAGVRNLGPTAAALHISFNETAGAIAFFTNNGLKATDSGISLTRAIENLMNPTAEAQTLLDQLGITVFDMEGKFVGLPSLFDQLHTSMSGMTDEQRQLALSTIFGAEAIDVMTLAVLQGGDPLRELIKLTEQQGLASEQSAKRMDTLSAQFDSLKEGITTFLGTLMQGLLPGMRLVVDFANAIVDALMLLPGPIKTVIGAVMSLAAAFAALRVGSAALGFLGMGGGLLGGISAAPFLALAAGIAVAYAAIRFNLLGIGDAVETFRDTWRSLGNLGTADNPIAKFLIATGAALRSFDMGLLNQIAAGLGTFGVAVESFFDAFNGPGGGGGNLKTNIDVTGDDKVIEWVENADAPGGFDYKVRIKNPDGSFKEFGDVMESYTDENDPNIAHIRIKTDDGEYWTTVEKDTGVVGEGTIEVNVDGKSEKKTRKTIDRIQDGLDAMTKSLEESDYPWLAQFPRAASRAIDSLRTFTEGFRMAREAGADPLEASLRALGMTFPGLSDATARLEMGWRDMKDTFQAFRDQGVGPVSSALLTLGETFPSLRTAMAGLAGVTMNLGDAFQAAMRGDWSQAFEELGMAARSAWVVIQEVASGIGGLVVDLWDWSINVGVPAVTGWIADNAGDIGRAILAAGGWVVDNIIAPIGSVTLQIAGWLIESAQTAWEAIKNWVLGRAGGLQGGGGAAGGAAARAAGGSIPIGPVALLIGGWIVNAAQSAWEAIKAWVLGTGGGLSGTGRATGGAVASAAGTGIPIGAVSITISEWKIVAGAGDVWNAITSWVDDKITVTDAEAAAFEPKGREIGASIMRAIINGITGAFESGDVGGGRSSGGGGGGPIGAGGSFGGGLGRYIMPILDGAWDELQPVLENWGTQLKRNIQQWWNGFAPSLLQFDTLAGSPLQQGGDTAFKGLADAIAGPTMFESILTDIRGKWEGFKEDVQGIFDEVPTIDLPSIDIDWGSFGSSIAEGWQGAMDLLQNVLDWLKNPWENAGSIKITLPSISIDLGPIDTLIDQINAKVDALKAAWNNLRFWENGGDGEGGGAAGSTGGSSGKKAGPFSGAAGSGFDADAFASMGRSASAAFANAFNAGLANVSPTVTVTAETGAAMGAMTAVQGAMAALNGSASTVQVLGDNAGALAAVAGAAGALGGIEGRTAQTFVNGDNSNALGAVMGAAAALGGFDGTVATAYLEAVDNVSGAVSSALAAVRSLDGATATAYLNVVTTGGAGLGGRIPGRATGGTVREPLTLVGERGPELVSLPYGSYVHPTGTGPQMGAITNVYVTTHVAGNVVGVDDLANEMTPPIMHAIQRGVHQRQIAKGMSA